MKAFSFGLPERARWSDVTGAHLCCEADHDARRDGQHDAVRGRRRVCLLPAALALAAAAPSLRAQARGESRIEWRTPAVVAPRVTYETFDSAAAGTRVSYHLYTPAAYANSDGRRFPVVYWLHGSGGGLAGIEPLARLIDAAIASGRVPPMLVVFVNGLRMGMYVDWSNGAAPVETVIVRDLLRHIDATYRTIATREGRLLDGFSMGGYGAARLGFKHPGLFRAVSIVGAGPMQETLTHTPRASGMQARELLDEVYGGDQERFPGRESAPTRRRERRAHRPRIDGAGRHRRS